MRKIRNKFAHHINPRRTDLALIVDKPYFILHYMEDGMPKEEQIMWSDIEERFKDFSKIVDATGKIMKSIQEIKKSNK